VLPGSAFSGAGVRVIGEAVLGHLRSIGNISDEDSAAVLALRGDVRSLRRHEEIIKAGDSPAFSVVRL
jgi:hypothetical protein